MKRPHFRAAFSEKTNVGRHLPTLVLPILHFSEVYRNTNLRRVMSCLLSNTYEAEQNSDFELTEKFLNTFQLLSVKQQKIWQLLQWYSTHYRNVFPSHATIAEKVGCCRDTVIETIKKFRQWGWICALKRCYRSNVYFLQECLKKLDTRKNETFMIDPTENPTQIPTENPTLYNTYSYSSDVRNTSSEQKTVDVQDIKSEKEHILRKIGISLPKDIFCLSRFKYHTLCKAYEDLITRWYKSGPINNLAAWITSRCKKYE